MLSSPGSVSDSIHSLITAIQHVHRYYDFSLSQFASILQHFNPCDRLKISSKDKSCLPIRTFLELKQIVN